MKNHIGQVIRDDMDIYYNHDDDDLSVFDTMMIKIRRGTNDRIVYGGWHNIEKVKTDRIVYGAYGFLQKIEKNYLQIFSYSYVFGWTVAQL
jgi:hypothetical protein